MPTIQFPSGERVSGRSWQQVLDRLGELPFNDFEDEYGLREALAKRAWSWSHVVVDPGASPVKLFHQLADAGMIKIVRKETS